MVFQLRSSFLLKRHLTWMVQEINKMGCSRELALRHQYEEIFLAFTDRKCKVHLDG